jgi:hypothetical protein
MDLIIKNKSIKDNMKKIISLIIIVITFISCNGQNFLDKEYSYNTIDENGGSNFLNIKIDKNGKVTGNGGYLCCELGEADSWDGEIKGTLKDNEIDGSYKYEAEGEKYNSTLKIKLFDDYATFKEGNEKELKLNLEKTTVYTENYYKNRINVVNWNETSVMEGKVILKNLTNPVTEQIIKDCLVLKLKKKIHIWGEVDNDGWIITEEIRIYGNQESNEDLNKKHADIIGKNVLITGKVTYAPSGYYPLLANLIGDFDYEIVN